MTLPETSLRQHPYPMIRGGGMFVFLMGLGIAAGAFLGERRFVAPLIIGFTSAFVAQSLFARRLTRSLGKPTRAQVMALAGAILLEFVLTGAVFYFFRHDFASGSSLRGFWLWILLVVGIHFPMMAVAQGPWMLLLGGLCILNAIAGLLLPNVPLVIFWFMDGALKMLIGARMFMAQPIEHVSRES
jgi:hypothetical protein